MLMVVNKCGWYTFTYIEMQPWGKKYPPAVWSMQSVVMLLVANHDAARCLM